MKYLNTLAIIIIAFTGLRGQSTGVDPVNPISEISLGYTNGPISTTGLTIVFNAAKGSGDSTRSNSISRPKLNITGSIVWADQPSDPKKTILSDGRFFDSPEKPFVSHTDLYDGNQQILLQASESNDWKRINLKLSYSIDGEVVELPSIALYPPPVVEEEEVINRVVRVNPKAQWVGEKEAVFTVESLPPGIQFEITEFTLLKYDNDSTEPSTQPMDKGHQGDRRFTRDGKTQIHFLTDTEIDISSDYMVSLKAIDTYSGKEISTGAEATKVFFIKEFPPSVINREEGRIFQIPCHADKFRDDDIQMVGDGTLGIRFLNKDFELVNPTTVRLGGDRYAIDLDGLQTVPMMSSSTYYYINKETGATISPALTITKSLPKVESFKFDGVSQDSLMVSFEIEGDMGDKDPVLNISGSVGILPLGNVFVTKQPRLATSPTEKYHAKIYGQISQYVLGNKITDDLTIGVTYAEETLYSLTVTAVNRKLYDETRAKLEAEVDSPKGDRSRENIVKWVDILVGYGKAVGTSIEDPVVRNAVDELKNGNNSKVSKVMSDIGKWALIVGKIVLPIG
jgi:hypothetical protein